MPEYCPLCGGALVHLDAIACPMCRNVIRQNVMPNDDALYGISIRGFSLGNLISLIGATLGIIAIFLPWIEFTVPLLERQIISLYGLSDIFKLLSQLIYTFTQGPLHASVSGLSYSWLLLLCLLLVCGYSSISGKGTFVHIGVGLLQIGILVLFYRMFIGISGYVVIISSFVPGLIVFQIGYGFYIAFICALLLIIGGICELRE